MDVVQMGGETTMPQGTRPHKKPPVPGSFGAAIRAIRERKGLSQTQLGEITGLGQNNISRIETGTVLRPQEATLELLARALEVEPFEIWRLTTYHELEYLTADLRRNAKELPVESQNVLAHVAAFMRDHPETTRNRDPERILDLFRQALREAGNVGNCANGNPA
jgi:transcriptional regulator with XRE-family HTH domain